MPDGGSSLLGLACPDGRRPRGAAHSAAAGRRPVHALVAALPTPAPPAAMPLLFLAYLLAAALAIACTLVWPAQWLAFALLKPLTTALVIVHAWRRGTPGDARRGALLTGLGLSLIGDVALLWPQQGFLPGLVAFLLAHLAYLWAFTRGERLAARPSAFVAYAAVAGAVLAWLWPGVPGALRAPVLVYVMALAAMAAQAASVWLSHRGDSGPVLRASTDATLAARAAAGGAAFMLSDALLAANRFASPLPAAALWILASYWAAQWLIASSLAARR